MFADYEEYRKKLLKRALTSRLDQVEKWEILAYQVNKDLVVIMFLTLIASILLLLLAVTFPDYKYLIYALVVAGYILSGACLVRLIQIAILPAFPLLQLAAQKAEKSLDKQEEHSVQRLGTLYSIIYTIQKYELRQKVHLWKPETKAITFILEALTRIILITKYKTNEKQKQFIKNEIVPILKQISDKKVNSFGEIKLLLCKNNRETRLNEIYKSLKTNLGLPESFDPKPIREVILEQLARGWRVLGDNESLRKIFNSLALVVIFASATYFVFGLVTNNPDASNMAWPWLAGTLFATGISINFNTIQKLIPK